ncbi:MAG: anion permease [Flavobacteriaceae bacterium]|jgi:phosphate/sulfate permease|tara:strand:+ start:73 stop:2376 length:2304 start_codon:yes stop_codon:yes gene_type:complete
MDFYLVIIIALAVLATADLVVGVSNDAVNFLNSAIGSKAISFKTVMIIASLGVAAGAIFSSGLMEVARKGIFNPELFYFDEIMVIFMAVMLTDILLLDFFNTLGLPTSTTVSIVFELLGAAVAISLVKIYMGGASESLMEFINVSKASQIVFGILLSVFIAFTVGAVVQYVSRLILTFNFKDNPKWIGAIFGGIAMTAITYFILAKGIKGTPFADNTYAFLGGMSLKEYIATQSYNVIGISLVLWTSLSMLGVYLFRTDNYKSIIIVGTFSLALAFAGNDLVNFIGVPIAAWQSFEAWKASGVSAELFNMAFLSAKVSTPTFLLIVAGMIMVATLWFSTKAQEVLKTSIDLSRQERTQERFDSNALSRGLVRAFAGSMRSIEAISPSGLKEKVKARFTPPKSQRYTNPKDEPAFDNVRASINLTVAAVLISIATSYKLPLSTTYVTFMVAMGTSLADRAWGADSAVYRVAGVLNVIGGWFLTALTAFTACGIVAVLIYAGKLPALLGMFAVTVFILLKNYKKHKNKLTESKRERDLKISSSSSVQSLILESAKDVSKVISKCNDIYLGSINGLAKQNAEELRKCKKDVFRLGKEIDKLRNELFYFIQELEEENVKASHFYISLISILEDMAQSLEYITKASYKHVHNNHRQLKYSQIKELKETQADLEGLLSDVRFAFDIGGYEALATFTDKKDELFANIDEKINQQVQRTRSKEEKSPKNTTLFFGLMVETKDLIVAPINLIEHYHLHYDPTVAPKKLGNGQKKDK